jgi:hypothetical protein
MTDTPSTPTPPPQKPRNAHPEHNLQTQIVKWVRECVVPKHKLKCYDRSKNSITKKQRAQGRMGRHLFEWQRGITPGTLDTDLVTEPHAISHRIELKAPGVKIDPVADEHQIKEIAELRELGGFADWTNSVTGYATLLRDWGVELRPLAMVRAQDLDLLLLGKKMRREGLLPKKARRSSGKPRSTKPSGAALAAMHRTLWR